MNSNFIVRLQGHDELNSGIYYEVDLAQPPIGVGGMGQVFAGQMISANGLSRDVAVKFLFENLPTSMIARAEREASIRLHNDNLAEMIAFVPITGQNDDGTSVTRIHVVSELLTGVMLYDVLNGTTTDRSGNEVPLAQELLKTRAKEPKTFATTILRKVLSGIMALHDAGYIHRDLDPSNIMLTQDSKIKIIDFGIARSIGDNHDDIPQPTSAGNFVGKASYAAPELILGDIQHQNQTTDIYALGILLFQLYTGHLPFEGPLHDIMMKQRNSQLPLDEIGDADIKEIIRRATEKEQCKRFQSAAEMRVALDNVRASSDVAPPVPPTPPTTNPEGSVFSKKDFIILTAVAVIGVICGAIISLI